MKIVPTVAGIIIGLVFILSAAESFSSPYNSCVGYTNPVNIWELALPVPFWLIFILALAAFGIGIYQSFTKEEQEK